MTYRSLTSCLVVSFLSVAGFAACSADPEDPYSGTPSDLDATGQPRNVDGPGAYGVDSEGNLILAQPVAAGTGMGGQGNMSGVLAPTSGVLAPTSGVLAPASTDMGGGNASADISCDIIAEVFEPSCGTNLCHGAGATNGDFAASEAQALTFRDVPVVGPTNAACGPYIDTQNPLNSALWTKTQIPACGGLPMPLNRLFDDEQRDCLREWLESL